jgi:hypothetical protein
MQTNVKAVAIRILEYVFENYNVNCREVSTVHAFEISVVSICSFFMIYLCVCVCV